MNFNKLRHAEERACSRLEARIGDETRFPGRLYGVLGETVNRTSSALGAAQSGLICEAFR